MFSRFKNNPPRTILRISVLFALLLSLMVVACIRLIDFQLIEGNNHYKLSQQRYHEEQVLERVEKQTTTS